MQEKNKPTILSLSSEYFCCYYGLQFDTYPEFCTHACSYCWAIDRVENKKSSDSLDSLKDLFYLCFETDKDHHLKDLIKRKIPLRIGMQSDPFVANEEREQRTLETLKILKNYDYPIILFTKSNKIAEDIYLKEIQRKNVMIQLSFSTLDIDLAKRIEPNATSPFERLVAMQKIQKQGIKTAVRLNPLFPIYPDQHYVFKKTASNLQLPIFNYSMIETFAHYDCKNLITGFVHLSQENTNKMSNILHIDLRSFMTEEMKQQHLGFKYSPNEIRQYYEKIKSLCLKNKIDFSTCYLGYNDITFWKNKDLWENKKDCCHFESLYTTNNLSLHNKIKLLPKKNFRIIIYFIFKELKNFLLKKLFEK